MRPEHGSLGNFIPLLGLFAIDVNEQQAIRLTSPKDTYLLQLNTHQIQQAEQIAHVYNSQLWLLSQVDSNIFNTAITLLPLAKNILVALSYVLPPQTKIRKTDQSHYDLSFKMLDHKPELVSAVPFGSCILLCLRLHFEITIHFVKDSDQIVHQKRHVGLFQIRSDSNPNKTFTQITERLKSQASAFIRWINTLPAQTDKRAYFRLLREKRLEAQEARQDTRSQHTQEKITTAIQAKIQARERTLSAGFSSSKSRLSVESHETASETRTAHPEKVRSISALSP